MDRTGGVHVPRRGLRHEPGGEIDRIAEAHERSPHHVPVGAAPYATVRDPDLDLASGGRALELQDLERRCGRARRVVLVGEWRPEDRVEIRALVAEGELEEVAPVVGEYALRPADEVVELGDRVVVGVVVDPREANEHGDSGAELGEELPAPGAQPFVDGGEAPGAHELFGQRVVELCHRRSGHVPGECADQPGVRSGFVFAKLGHPDPIAKRLERRCSEDDLSRLGQLLDARELVDQPPGEDVDELDLRIADDEAPRLPDHDGDLHSQLHVRPARRGDVAFPGDRLLHGQAARDGAHAVVAVDPARDRVAAEVDDVAAVRVELRDDRVEDAVQVRGQLLGAALRAELGRQGFGQRRESGDVGEER